LSRLFFLVIPKYFLTLLPIRRQRFTGEPKVRLSRFFTPRRGARSERPVSIEHLMRVLLLNLGVDSLQAANSSLASQGYDVATNRDLAVDQVLALSPEVSLANCYFA
jgi:hypothetical protein